MSLSVLCLSFVWLHLKTSQYCNGDGTRQKPVLALSLAQPSSQILCTNHVIRRLQEVAWFSAISVAPYGAIPTQYRYLTTSVPCRLRLRFPNNYPQPLSSGPPVLAELHLGTTSPIPTSTRPPVSHRSETGQLAGQQAWLDKAEHAGRTTRPLH
jgi:hypothetical protein